MVHEQRCSSSDTISCPLLIDFRVQGFGNSACYELSFLSIATGKSPCAANRTSPADGCAAGNQIIPLL
jgi:hypothetical protein